MSVTKKTLGELCIIEKGKIGIQKAIPGEYPLVVTAEERLSHNEYHFEGNAVVIPLVSSTGHGHKSLKRIHFQSGKFAVGNILCAVMPKDETVLNAEYLYRFLDLNREKELVGRMKGMANVSLPLKEIALIEIPLPPVAEQLKFVESYKQLETAKNKLDIELTHQLTLVKQLRQSFLREAMQGKLTADFRCAHPELIEGENSAQALLEKIKVNRNGSLGRSTKKEKELAPVSEDEIPFEIPEGWVWCRLGDICSVKGGKRTPAGYQLQRKPTPYIYLRVTDMQNGTIVDTDLHYIDESIYSTIKNYTISKDDIYMTIVGATIGKCGLIPERFDGANLTENAVKVTPYLLKKEFLYLLLKMPFAQNQFIEKTKKVGVEKMAIFRFINTALPLPPLSEQQAIVSKLDKLMRTCDELETSIRTSQQQNEMLLQQVLREALNG